MPGHCRRKRPWRCGSCRKKLRDANRHDENWAERFGPSERQLMNKQFEARRSVVRAMPWDGAKMSREILLDREWLVTNGLGGYASGTRSEEHTSELQSLTNLVC